MTTSARGVDERAGALPEAVDHPVARGGAAERLHELGHARREGDDARAALGEPVALDLLTVVLDEAGMDRDQPEPVSELAGVQHRGLAHPDDRDVDRATRLVEAAVLEVSEDGCVEAGLLGLDDRVHRLNAAAELGDAAHGRVGWIDAAHRHLGSGRRRSPRAARAKGRCTPRWLLRRRSSGTRCASAVACKRRLPALEPQETMPGAVIAGAAEVAYTRHPAGSTTTESLLAAAFRRALDGAGIDRDEVDGLAVSSFTLVPDHAIDLAWRLGLPLRWIMEDTNGGASALNMLQHAVRAVEAGDAGVVVVLAGDRFDREGFHRLVDTYNRATVEHLAPLAFGGPNALFALLTRRHMAVHGLERRDYGHVALAQRSWAGLNPGAVYREPLTMEEYLAAPVVAEPLHRFDCPPVVSGADALIVTTPERATAGVRVRALRALHNVDGQEGDGLRTGLAVVADDLWAEAGLGPPEVDVVSVYDDYPAMVLVQLADLGFVEGGDVARFVRERLAAGQLPINTSGGQLSAGQAGAAGGMHGLVEAVTQLRGEAGERQVGGARTAVVSGYGMVLYRYGACANAAVLERA